jgi:transcriptional regulator
MNKYTAWNSFRAFFIEYSTIFAIKFLLRTMYNIPYFKADNYKQVFAFMHAHPFIILCGCDVDNSPVATHIPVLIEERDEKIFLKAHVMRKQKHAVAFEHNQNVLAIFSGAHTYVSASWYHKKEVASTWNYQAVHAKGTLHWKDENFLHELLTSLQKNLRIIHIRLRWLRK